MRSKAYFLFILSILLTVKIFTPEIGEAQSQKPESIIFDSDIGPDYDDVGALTELHALADQHEAQILATIASNRYSNIAAVLNVLNTYFGRSEIPIGVPRGQSVEMKDWQGWSDYIVSHYPHQIKSNDEVPGSVEVYRKILSQQPDQSVTIVTVGFLTNLAKLIQSKPDQYSNLNGLELVRSKVKRLVSMAGRYPSGKEFNILKDISSAQTVTQQWPTDIIFSGYEIGKEILTGIPLIHNEEISNSPVKDVFRISINKSEEDKNGRKSWDETAVLVAVRGAAPYFHKVQGRITIDDDGTNHWDSSGDGHYYLVQDKSVKYMEDLINGFMQHQPVN